MTDAPSPGLDELLLRLRALGRVLNVGGNVAPAEFFARIHDELLAAPDAATRRRLLDELLSSSRLATKHGFDEHARQTFAAMWMTVREIVATLDGERPAER